MHNSRRLKLAAERGDKERVLSLCTQPDDQFTPLDDHNNCLIHAICGGRAISPVARFLLGWPVGIRPAPDDAARASLLTALLAAHPHAALLVCARNEEGDTPAHLCVQTASLATLKELVGGAARLLGPQKAALLLAAPDAQGRSALDVALASQQWAAAALLARCAPLSRQGVLAANDLESRAQLQRRSSSRGGGVLGSMLNWVWDSWGGKREESENIQRHRRQQLDVAARTNGNGVKEIDYAAPAVPLGDLEAVLQRRERLIQSVATSLSFSASEAQSALVAAKWEPDVAISRFQRPHKAMPAAEEDTSSSPFPSSSAASTASSSAPSLACMVCFEPKPTGLASDHPLPLSASFLPCSTSHYTCDDCWKGILTANPQTACCPNLSCRLPLPLPGAEAILPAEKFSRVARLQARAFVSSSAALRWCPAPGCTFCLQLPASSPDSSTPEHSATTRASADFATSAMESGRGQDARCSCGFFSCWACGESAHEPATCAQAQAWEDELRALREAAPVLDRRYLLENARQCPGAGCGAFVQRTGGCNHMTCSSCGEHWCWECRRSWKEHGSDTGGFYFCSLEGEAGGAGSGGVAGGDAAARGNWLREAFRSVQGIAAQATLQRALGMRLRHECDPATLRAVAAHAEDMLGRLGQNGEHSSSEAPLFCLAGPEDIGISSVEAADMLPEEWARCVQAACDSAAGSLKNRWEATGRLPNKEEAAGGWGDSPAMKLDLAAVAEAVIEAHRALQSSAAALRALPGGASRSYLLELCGEVESPLERLEQLLLDVPHQQEAVACRASVGAAATAAAANGGVASSGLVYPLRMVIIALVKAWHGSRVPAAPQEQSRLPGLSAHVVLAQAQYILALQRVGGRVNADAAALRRAVSGLKVAGRRGLFSGATE